MNIRSNLLILFLALFAATALAQMSPMPMSEGFVTTDDGAQIYYTIHGEGQPLVLIHGYPLNGGLFRDNVGPLSERFQVVTVDLRGFGQSMSSSDGGSIERYAMDVLAVMGELGLEQAVVGGMSMGGITAFEMYRQAPERFAGLILIDTVHLPAGPAEAGLWRGAATQAQEMGVASLVDVFLKDMVTGDTRMNRPEIAEHLTSLVEQAAVEGAVDGGNALADRPDSSDTLAQISVPTLIIVGLEDTVTPYEVHQMMNEGIMGSELVIISGAAHAATLEAADETNAAILEWAQGLE
ncbi:MAG: alpha/beta hydrolase [Trueperaceae bacterium]|nr:alpha/beta hydrolase [Trueperaceae bacterium]